MSYPVSAPKSSCKRIRKHNLTTVWASLRGKERRLTSHPTVAGVHAGQAAKTHSPFATTSGPSKPSKQLWRKNVASANQPKIWITPSGN